MSHLSAPDEADRNVDPFRWFHHVFADLVLLCLLKEKRQLQGLNLRG